MALTKPKLSQNIDTDISVFSDPILVLHQGSTSANLDVGFLMNRSNGLTSNAAVIWQESTRSFVHILTNDSGASNSNLSVQSYANVSVGNVLLINNAGIYVDGTLGSAGQVLASDGSKTYWAPPGGFTGGTVSGLTVFQSNLVVSNTTPSTSNVTGALVVLGGIGTTGNVFANVLYTYEGIRWAGNGAAFASGGGSFANANVKIYLESLSNVNIGLGTGVSQGADAVAIGIEAGNTTQSTLAIAIGPYAGNSTQGEATIAIGSNGLYGNTYGGEGYAAGGYNQGSWAVAIGTQAGAYNQATEAIAIGDLAGTRDQGLWAIAIGLNAGQINQGPYAVGIGVSAGETGQAQWSVAVGQNAGKTNQGPYAVGIGGGAGQTSQGQFGVAVGYEAGQVNQGNYGVAVGNYAGTTNQGLEAVAIGGSAGQDYQGQWSVAIGSLSGGFNQGESSVAVGVNAGYSGQGNSAVAIGDFAGRTAQGYRSVAIGAYAGYSNQAGNSIIISANGQVDSTTSGFFVDPVRNVSSSNVLYYNSATKEITFDTSPVSYSNTNVAAYLQEQNISSANIGTLFLGNLSTNANLGAFQAYANTKIGTNTNSNLVVVATTTSTSTTTGALVVSGGVGIGGNLNVSGNVVINPDQSTIASALVTSDFFLLAQNATAPGLSVLATGSSSAHRPVFKGTRARGTLDSPIVPNANDQVLSFLGAIYDGAITQGTAAIDFVVDGSVSSGVAPQRISFVTSATTAAARTERLQIASNGNVVITGTTTSTSNVTGALVVRGGVGVAGNVYANVYYTSNGIYWAGNGASYISGGGITYTASNTAPVSPSIGDQWYYVANDILFEYLNDGDTNQWVDVNGLGQLATSNVTLISDAILQGNITVQNDTLYSIGTNNGYLKNAFVSNLVANVMRVSGVSIVSGNLVAAATTTSTSTTTGALVVRGGVGINGNVFVGATGAGALRAGAFITNALNLDPAAATWGNIAAVFGKSTTQSGTGIVGWNRSAGGGEMSFIQNKNGGSTGGFRFYDWPDTSINTTNPVFNIAGTGNVTVYGNILPNANLSYNIGSGTTWFGTIYGVSTQALYADLAENYIADADYQPGTVVIFGGACEVTVSTSSHDTRIAGVVSHKPAYLMNSAKGNVSVALTGRVPCRVLGPVNKGSVLVSGSIAGVAQAVNTAQYQPGCVIGKSLETIEDSMIKTIEIAVGRF